MPRDQPIIGLAGGIGSGKSTAARFMGEQGAWVIHADPLARQAMDQPHVRQQLHRWWGDQVFDADGRVDRSAVAARVFERPDERRRLESLIHPIVAAERDRQIEQARRDPSVRAIVLDVPLLFEVGLDRLCDRVVFVRCDRDQRLRRLAETRGWDEAELQRRERSQMPPDEKSQRADDIIDNNDGEDACRAQVRQLLDRITA